MSMSNDKPTTSKPERVPLAANQLHVRSLRLWVREAEDPLAEAEAAVKKLRQDANDKQAVDALERALKRLKERAKPDGAAGSQQKQ